MLGFHYTRSFRSKHFHHQYWLVFIRVFIIRIQFRIKQFDRIIKLFRLIAHSAMDWRHDYSPRNSFHQGAESI